jgi:hypothetical protein
LARGLTTPIDFMKRGAASLTGYDL